MSQSVNLPRFIAGEPLYPQLTAARLNAILDAVDRNRTVFGDNITGQRTPGGTIVRSQAKGGDENVDLEISFLLSDSTTTVEGEVNNQVSIVDGKIQGDFPAGMGFGGFTLNLLDPDGALIYAGATFDVPTLTINSRFLQEAASSSPPESRVDEDGGFAYWLLGFTYFDGDGLFKIHQCRLGDIYFSPTYGDFNGMNALWIDQEIGWLDLEAIITP